MGSLSLCVIFAVGIFISQGQGAYLPKRNFIGDTLGAISSATGLDSAVKGVTNIMGAVENAISPSAMYNFCHQNGYTQWRGSGPEPEAPSGAIGGAWSAVGSITGGMVGSWAPDVVFQGKCHPLGWFNPTEPGSTSTISSQGRPGYTTTQIIQGSSPQYQVLPGTPGYTTQVTYPGTGPQYQVLPGSPQTTTQYYPGSPPEYRVLPGSPGYTTTTTSRGSSPQYQVSPGNPGYTTTTSNPGNPPRYQVSPGNPGYTTTVQYPGNPPQCQCPCNG